MTHLIPCGRSLVRVDEWIFRQEWKEAVFLHWPLPAAILQSLLHTQLAPDLYNGSAWISIVVFSAKRSMLRLPFRKLFPILPDFDELNLRTYVTHKGVKGVHFIDIKADKLLPVLFNSALGLPYKWAATSNQPGRLDCRSRNIHLDIKYTTEALDKDSLDLWLTERYYTFQFNDKHVFEFPICHKEWPLEKVHISEAAVEFSVGDVPFRSQPSLAHYSQGVEAFFWPAKKQ